MSPIITVHYLDETDHFVATDPDTGTEKAFNSAIFHTGHFTFTSTITDHMLAAFPGKSECNCDASARNRMQSIVDFNNLTDEVQF